MSLLLQQPSLCASLDFLLAFLLAELVTCGLRDSCAALWSAFRSSRVATAAMFDVLPFAGRNSALLTSSWLCGYQQGREHALANRLSFLE